MNYLHSVVKALKGNQIKVSIDQPTRVLLLDRIQFKNYQDHRTFTYRGGQTEEEEIFQIPKNGEWHIVVELRTKNQRKDVNASISKLVAPKR